MNVPLVDLKIQYRNHQAAIDAAIQGVIAETAFIRGKYVADFEAQYAAAYGVKHCIGTANGTDALFVVLKMLGIGPGDEVITTANSWIATSEVVDMCGATPVFVDVDPRTFNIDVNQIAAHITSRTRALLPVHLLGQPADLAELVALAEQHGLALVEDCAQAHFATYGGRRVGTFGIAGCFSFYPGKNLGAFGDAGGIITDDDELAEQCRMYANHGALVKGDHRMPGMNARLDGLQAAILSAKLPHIHDWTAARRRVADRYDAALADLPQVVTPYRAPGRDHVFHVYQILAAERDGLEAHLKAAGVGTQRHYPVALPLMQAYASQGHTAADFPVEVANCARRLSLPIFPEMSDEQLDYVTAQIHQFYGR